MKVQNKFFAIIFIVFVIFTGCSNKPSLELITSSVGISNDRLGGIGITSGERKGEIIRPIALSYDFILKNSGSKTLGGMKKPNSLTFGYDDGIKVFIEPKDELKAVVKEVMGFNIFDEEERKQQNNLDLSLGIRNTPVLKPDGKGNYSFDYELGAKEENPEIRIAPSQTQLDKLEKYALEATLVIYIEDEQIARFDLNNLD